jgi:hypothetical protein
MKKRSILGILIVAMMFSFVFPSGAVFTEDKVSDTVVFGDTNKEVSDTVIFGSADKDISDTVEISDEQNALPRASNHTFSDVWLGTSRPSSMTFTMNDIVFQKNGTIVVSGTTSKPGTVFSCELYKKVSGNWVLISSAQRVDSSQSTGTFSWSTSYGANGDYGIKMWGDTACSISGNLIY